MIFSAERRMLEQRPWLKIKQQWHFNPVVLWPGLLGEKGRCEGSQPPHSRKTPHAPEMEIPNPNYLPQSSVGWAGGIWAPACEEGWYPPSPHPAPQPLSVRSWDSHSNLSVASRDIWLRGWNWGFHTLSHSSFGGRASKRVKKLTHDYSSEQKKIICHKLKEVLPNFAFGQKDRYTYGRTQISFFSFFLDQYIPHTTFHFQMSVLGIKIKPFLEPYLETLDHAKIQRKTVLEAAGLVFYPPSHHATLHPSHPAISVSRARSCSHSAELISAGQMCGGVSLPPPAKQKL